MTSKHKAPFNRPTLAGREYEYIKAAVDSGQLSGNGPFSKRCHQWIERRPAAPAPLTHSCTAALRCRRCCWISSRATKSSCRRSRSSRRRTPRAPPRGARVRHRADTLNLDETLIERAITPRTRDRRATMPACPVRWTRFSTWPRAGLAVVEDAAQGIKASYRGRARVDGSFRRDQLSRDQERHRRRRRGVADQRRGGRPPR